MEGEAVGWAALGWAAWYTVGVIALMVVALAREVARPGLLVLGALAALLLGGVISPEEAFAGFSNPAVLTVAALYVVAAGVQRTDALAVLDRVLFARAERLPFVLVRFMLPTSVLSAFLNNTPIVAMLTPRLQEWAQARGVAASKLMIPLSYAAIAGGMCTLLGTSTNLVVSGLMEAEGYAPLGFFDVTWIGLPAALGVIGYFALGGHRLLPDRQKHGPAVEEGLQDCLFEAKVTPGSPLDGQSIEDAGLRALGNAYLVHVRRDGRMQQAGPQTMLRAGDTLTFAGHTAALGRLLQRPGFERGVPALEDVDDEHETLPLYEAVVAPSSRLVGKTLREANFREQYRGVVLAIQRKDEQITSSLGRTPIRAGDLLLIEAPSDFERRWIANRDEFYLVAARPGAPRARARHARRSLLILVSMVTVAATGLVPIVTAAFAAALAMILTRCLRGREAADALDLEVLAVIAGALGIGHAVEVTGLAAALAGGIVGTAAPLGVVAVLVALYVATNLLTELVTNNAAAALMLPVALAVTQELGLAPEAIGILVAVAASASFITPIGYQTNLMVMAPGGYRFGDYARVGVPASLIVMAIAVAVVYTAWM